MIGRTRMVGGFGPCVLIFAALMIGRSALAADELALPGRVIDLETRKPVVGAEIEIRLQSQSIRRPAAVKTLTKTDAEGRFAVPLPQDEADWEPMVSIRISHPGFISRLSRGFSVARLRDDAAHGERSPFASIPLETGLEYSLSVISSDNKPIAGALCDFDGNEDNNPSQNFSDDELGTTDSKGVVRVRMSRCRGATVSLSAAGFAMLHQGWNEDEQEDKPPEDLPTDLGRLVMVPGVSLSGKVLDRKGEPIAGFGVTAYCQENAEVFTTRTDRAGEFFLTNLHEGSYVIHALAREKGQAAEVCGGWSQIGVDPPTAGEMASEHIVKPEIVTIPASGEAPPVVLRAVETVKVRVRFVDPTGRPTRGTKVTISGEFPPKPSLLPKISLRRLLARLRGDEAEEVEVADNVSGSFGADPDPEGRVEIRVPKGLQNASISLSDSSGLRAYQIRLNPKEPPLPMSMSSLDEEFKLDRENPVEYIANRSPRLVVWVRSEESGQPLDEATVSAYLIFNRNHLDGGKFEQVEPGRYVGRGFLPNIPLTLFVQENGFVTRRVESILLPEGGCDERTLFMAKRPEPAEVGTLAPPILVTTLDGTARSLADYQGRYVLVAMWSMQNGMNDLPMLKEVHKKYGADERFAMLGLNYDIEPKRFEDAIKQEKIGWPNARISETFDTITAAYGWDQTPSAVLIGPDGLIVAKALSGDAIENEIAKHLKKP